MRYFWFMFIPLFFIGGHQFLGLALWIAVIILFGLIGRAIFSAISTNATMHDQPYQPYQANQYQQPYEPYQQGYQQPYYQPSASAERQASQQYQAPQQQQYDQYEQPRAEYPQELPPMQQ